MQYDISYYLAHYRRRFIIVTLLLVVLLTGVTAYVQIRTAQQRAGKIAVPVEVVPRDATVVLSNKQPLPSSGVAYIAPGEYKVTVKKEGFTTQTRDLRVSAAAVPYIYIGLSGESREAKSWQERNARDYQKLEIITVEKNRDYTTLFRSANPIVEILPIKDPYYTIDYRNRNDTSIELIIHGTSPRYREAAVAYLRSKGYEPTDYHVVYDGFINPLEDTEAEQ